jgi:electron transfer flavoprotein alpha/beta subunit
VKHAAVLGDEHAFTDDGRDVQPEYLEHTLNEWDDAALEEALQTIEKVGSGEVVAVAIGPEDADASLRKVLAKGAHRAVRVWDDSLAAADPVTIARAIAGVAEREEPDLIFSGVQSSDQAHGATGTALARILGLPHAAVAIGLEWDGSSKLIVARELEGGTRHTFELPSPAVISIQTGINVPRYATMRMIKQAKKKPLVALDGSSVLDGTGGYVVRRMYIPEQIKAEMLGGSAAEIAEFIAGLVREKRGE